MTNDRNSGTSAGRDARGRFLPGNPGRPKGTRHKATLAAETLLDGEADTLTRKCIELALEGDSVAMRLCLERILPPVKERPVEVDLPTLDGPGDLPRIIGALLRVCASGEILPGEADKLAHILQGYVRAVELTEFDERLKVLEKHYESSR
jgi:hypothetical protein